ncbi:hypothetical protein BASA60_003372 [Batrachochytrium salamandrivorans]|nr:hypothetical protein BASA60_003372 [Batrachochytrium salamandrivorans]
MIALSRSSTKLTVRNDVMDFLLTLFLPTCSVSEVLGRNDAVQNVFTFFSKLSKTRLQGTPNALELAALSQVVTAPTDLSDKRINHSSHILGYPFGIVALFTSRNRFQEKR